MTSSILPCTQHSYEMFPSPSRCRPVFRCVVFVAVALVMVESKRPPRDIAWSLPPPPPPPGVVATCDQRNSCGPSNVYARLPFHARNCFCDAVCQIFGDCCADYVPLPPPVPDISGGTSTPVFTCQRVEDINTSFEYYIVDRCPREYSANATVRELCRNERLEGLFYRLPVAGRSSGLLYRNAYCALCSGEKDYVFWRVEHKCISSPGNQVTPPNLAQPEAALRYITQCVADLLPPEVVDGDGLKGLLMPRKCKSHVSKCDKRANRRGGRCAGATAYVYEGLQVSSVACEYNFWLEYMHALLNRFTSRVTL